LAKSGDLLHINSRKDGEARQLINAYSVREIEHGLEMMWQGDVRSMVIQGDELGTLEMLRFTTSAGLLHKHNQKLQLAGQKEFDGVDEEMRSRLDWAAFTVRQDR
jgi:hypothetical protein